MKFVVYMQLLAHMLTCRLRCLLQDMVKFGHSTREYVLLHAQSNA